MLMDTEHSTTDGGFLNSQIYETDLRERNKCEKQHIQGAKITNEHSSCVRDSRIRHKLHSSYTQAGS